MTLTRKEHTIQGQKELWCKIITIETRSSPGRKRTSLGWRKRTNKRHNKRKV